MVTKPERPRAAAAVLRKEGSEILLVKHHWRDGSFSWILPGGGLLPGESAEAAALRELYEETSLRGRLVRYLFTLPYKRGTSTTFLIEVDPEAPVILGVDPEYVPGEHILLVDVAWFPIAEVADLPEVRQVLACI